MLAGAVGTAVEPAVSDLHAVPNDHAPTVGAPGRKGMDRALKTIEHVSLVADHDGKRLSYRSSRLHIWPFSSFAYYGFAGLRNN